MVVFLKALILFFLFKGIACFLFPKFIQEYVGQYIIDAPLQQLQLIGLVILMASVLVWAVIW